MLQHMDLLARRLHDEKKFQSRLGFVTELFNGLLDDILLIESTLGPGAAARPLFRLGEINLAIYTMLSQSWGNIENGNHKAQVAMSFRGNPSQIKLVSKAKQPLTTPPPPLQERKKGKIKNIS